MKRIIIYISVLATIFFAGCQKNEFNNGSDTGDVTVKYAVATGLTTKAESAEETATEISDEAEGTTLVLSDASGNLNIPMGCEVTEGISGNAVSAVTKGTQVNTTGDDYKTLETFADIVGSFVAKAYDGEGTQKAYQTVAWSGSAWEATPIAYWSQGTSLNFLAYANLPGSQTATIASTGVSTEHTVPATAADQTDILFGHYQGNGGNTGTAEIRFDHPLTAVRFKYGTMDGDPVIQSISIDGVAESGTATKTPDGIITWSGVDSHDYTVSQSDDSGLSVDETTSVIGEPFLIIPQNLAENNVAVKVTFTDGTEVMAVISDGQWRAGYTNTYILGYVGSTEIRIIGTTSESVSEVSYLGGTVGVQVKSCDSENNSPVAYTFLYCEANADSTVTANWSSTAPSWLTTALPAGAGSSTYTSADGFATAQTGQPSTVTETHTSSDMLKARTVVGSSSNRRDLSMYDVFQRPTARNTANCYIVTAPGYYKFPMVYGNAIKNGAMNSSAYTVTASDSYLLKDNDALTNYNDAGITSPNILTDVSASLSDCTVELVWQEYHGLVDAIDIQTDLEDGFGFVTVDIDPDKSHIQEGNAVIALKKGNDIVWSWHIWICAPGITTYNLTYDSKTYTFMSPPLGTVCGTYNTTNSTEYPERKVYVKAVAADGTKSNTVSLVQTSHFSGISLSSGYSTAPFYQWGRKDPMVPSDGNWSVGLGNSDLKPVYDINNNPISITDGVTGGVTMGDAIKKPKSFYKGANSNWMRTRYDNLWNVNNSGGTENPIFTKSVYDPTPAGFRVPDVYALYAFRDSSPRWENYSETLTGGRKTSDGFMLYGFGYRDYSSGTPAHTGHCGRYWSCVPNNEFLCTLYIDDNNIVVRKLYSPSYGYSVCPVQDQ